MNNFDELLNNIKNKKDQTVIDDYFLNALTKENLKNYYIDPDANKDEVKAIKIMFESKKDLKKRVDEAVSYDPFCLEAFLVYYMKADVSFLYLRFETYYDEVENFAEFTAYEKKCYVCIMQLYVEFLFEIGNITKAIKVQKLLIKLTNKPEKYLEQLFDMYFIIEDADEMYRLYCSYELSAREYILLMVTELKHENEIKAQEVYVDMLKNIEYADYLDHIWDLDDKDLKQQQFYKIVDSSFEDIITVPDFFSWVAETRDKIGEKNEH